jgi:outer membrane protein assembly factor BamB
MNVMKKKTMSSAIAIFLMSTVVLTLLALPTANGQATRIAYPFVDAVPNPVGVNQETLINFGLINFLQTAADSWKDITVTITKPDGTTDTIGPVNTDSTGATGRSYVPDQIGTYFLQTNFPQQVYSNVTYLAAKSERLTLIVQADPIQYYPGQPLPYEYWTRPIDSQLREWYSLAGSWVAVPLGMYAPNNQGPESPHILWTRPIGDTMGGLAGGDTGDGPHGYGTGDAYEGKWVGSLIIGGVLYYNKYVANSPQQAVVAVDLHTGKELWTKAFPVGNQRIAFGQVLFFANLNYQGAFSYLWVTSGTNWYAFEPINGDLKFNLTNVPGGTNYYGPNGEILKYNMVNMGNASNPNWRLLKWNTTRIVILGKSGTADAYGSQTQGVTYDAAARGYDLNVSIPALNTAGATLPGSIQRVFIGDRVIGARTTLTEVNLWALSLQKGNEGALLFNKTVAAPSEWVEGNLTLTNWAGFDEENKVAVFLTKENRKYYGFSLETGDLIWEIAESEVYSNAWDATSGQRVRALAYGTFYSASVSGRVYAYNVTTGDLLWTYNATDPLHQNLYGNNWWMVTVFITDGKIYLGNMDHSPIDPKWRGAPFVSLNATTGELIWRIDGAFRQTFWGGRAIIGDSIIVAPDTYDQRIYAIGKGPSATTVKAADFAAPFDTPIVIKGSVTDVSPGTQSDALKLRFPNGVPAVSDTSMSDWMLYVYKQITEHTDVTGVEVKLTAIDSNMNTIDIGTATSDVYGNYGFSWKPQSAGTYQIVASFMGSKSYYGSTATTYLTVAEAPETPPEEPQQPIPDYTLLIVGMGIAMILAVAIVGILLLRKRA